MQNLGEEAFLQYMRHQFPVGDRVVGIGDDCAVVPAGQDVAWLITTDALVEGVHFLKDHISPTALGFKTVAVNVSDIAAMGGTPSYAFLSVALPHSTPCAWLKGLIEGIKQGCHKWNILLLGGDTVGSKRDLFLNLTLIGTAGISHIKYRHSAEPEDFICVTGCLGDSGAGLLALQQKIGQSWEVQQLIDKHFHPEPNPEEGVWLASQEDVHAMMDVSDGLNCDLKRLLRASKCGGIVDVSSLPISKELLKVCRENGWDAEKLGLTGGEDYCLLLTIAKHAINNIKQSFYEKFHKPLYVIGKVTSQRGNPVYEKEGRPMDIQLTDFQHF